MKKNIYFLIIVFLFTCVTQNAYACSPLADFSYPSPESVLSQDNTAIAMYEIMADGPSVPAILVIGNENSIMNMTFDLDKTSCGTRSKDFHTGEYVVSIFNKNDTKIHHSNLDAQFSYSFQSKSEAFKKFNELSKLWSERSDSEQHLTGDIYYSASSETLKPGISNKKDILNLQNALKIKLSLGNDFKLDGSYGPATITAVKQFQSAEGLKSDGIAGNLTQKKLETVILGQSENNNQETLVSNYHVVNYTLKPGMKENDNVKSLQSALKEKLHLGNDFKLDGSYGPATITAVKQFQSAEGLKNDGIAGTLTQKALSHANDSSIKKDIQKEATLDENTEATQQETQTNTNSDILDGEIKKILVRAKNEFINKSLSGQNYNEAYALVVKYNNDILAVTDAADPLYKSSGGGQYFIYFAKLSNGKYVCVDNDTQKELVEKDTKPKTMLDQVSCDK